MPYEVFDNDEVQWRTRRHAALLSSMASVAALLTVGVALAAWADLIALPLASGALALVWASAGIGLAVGFRRLRRMAWCVKVSEAGVVCYDYARRPIQLGWDRIERVDLLRAGLLIVGPAPCLVVVPHLFPDFAALSHSLVDQAEAHGVPVYVDGQPWQSLDVYAFFPGLEENAIRDL